MKRPCLTLLLSIIPLLPLAAQHLNGKGWTAYIDPETGCIRSMTVEHAGRTETIPFRTDHMSGPALEGIALKPDAEGFSGQEGPLKVTMAYQAHDDHLQLRITAVNTGSTPYTPRRLRLRLGVDGEMHTFPQWDEKLFPTLMRCEKSYGWGYLMSPRGIILALGTEEPVASYALNYIYEEKKEWHWGHQILTESFDLLHCLPLPDRHPQDLTSLPPGRQKTWTLHLGPVETLHAVKPTLAHWLQAPLAELERYTLTPGETTPLTIHSPQRPEKLQLTGPDGQTRQLPLKNLRKGGKQRFRLSLQAPAEPGTYRLTIEDRGGKQCEARFYVRKPWLWYLEQARNWTAQYPPLVGGSAEQFYGYYAAALGARHLPAPEKDEPLRQRFERRIQMIVDTLRGTPKQPRALPYRIQNFATAAGILTDYWQATHDLRYLRWASRIGDFLCCDSVQWSDGSYRSRQTHYTAVIYPAKSMMELALAEQEAARIDPTWNEAAQRHLASAMKAADDLARRLDNIETEGDMTFEDGMISCSALQMGMAATLDPSSQRKEVLTRAARYMMRKHECLEQTLIPDCRMRGATLRYWEALDVYFSPNQVMNSPHGWTAWKVYAQYYLYLLTGEEAYLSGMMDTIGACMQTVTDEGRLRWGFIPDPYVESWVCVPDPNNPRGWNHCDSIVGEQYLDLISPWLRPDNADQICDFGNNGGSGDNTLFEMFKALEECALTTAYIIVDRKGNTRTWNCKADLSHGLLQIETTEPSVEKIHINTSRPLNVCINGKRRPTLEPGLVMLTKSE